MLYRDAIKKLRTQALESIASKRTMLAEVRALTGQPGSGPERSRLRNHYAANVKPQVRATWLALGFLKGIPYTSMEPKCSAPPLQWGTWKVINAALEGTPLQEEWPLERVYGLFDAAKIRNSLGDSSI